MKPEELAIQITHKLKTYGIEPEYDNLLKKIIILHNDFGVPPFETERTVIEDILKENGELKREERSKYYTNALICIKNIQQDQFVTIEGEVVSVNNHPFPNVSQIGIIADETDCVRFIAFSNTGSIILERGKSYRIQSALTKKFKGSLSLKIIKGTKIENIHKNFTLQSKVTPIKNLSEGVASLKVKVIKLYKQHNERIYQVGLIADESGIIQFIIWKGQLNKEIKYYNSYLLDFVTVAKYNDRLCVSVDPQCSYLLGEEVKTPSKRHTKDYDNWYGSYLDEMMSEIRAEDNMIHASYQEWLDKQACLRLHGGEPPNSK